MELHGFGWKMMQMWESLVFLKWTSTTLLHGLVIVLLGILSGESRPRRTPYRNVQGSIFFP